MGSQRVGHDWASEQQQKLFFILFQDHRIFFKNIMILITENGEKNQIINVLNTLKFIIKSDLLGVKKRQFLENVLVYSQVIFVS